MAREDLSTDVLPTVNMTEWRSECAEVLMKKVNDHFALVYNIVSEVLHVQVHMEHACDPTCSMYNYFL